MPGSFSTHIGGQLEGPLLCGLLEREALEAYHLWSNEGCAARAERGMRMKWRRAAAAGVLAILALVAVQLLPYYLHNAEFQRFLGEAVAQQENRLKPEDQLRIAIVQRATALALPVRTDQIEIERSPIHIRIAVRYLVQVAVPWHAVNLHFSPAAEHAFQRP